MDARYDSRTLAYLERAALPEWGVTLVADEDDCAAYATQVTLLTAVMILARLTRHIDIQVPDVSLSALLVHPERSLLAALRLELQRARNDLEQAPDTALIRRGPVLSVGRAQGDVCARGAGWLAQVSDAILLPPDHTSTNPIGPALAATWATSQVFQLAVFPEHRFRPATINAWGWQAEAPVSGPEVRDLDLGVVWTVGTGSVGTAALHFLALATPHWHARLSDHDVVKLENISRSPIFGVDDLGECKVNVTADFLRARGITIDGVATTDLANDPAWPSRTAGYPDLMLSTANEKNIRWTIESGLPPVQVHATTGMSWQTTVFRHVPAREACALCAFPAAPIAATTKCSQGSVPITPTRSIDAALPFLSFAAGILATSELLKVAHAHRFEDLGPNRVYLQMRGEPVFVAPVSPRGDCICRDRNRVAVRQAVGERFAGLIFDSPTAPAYGVGA